MVVKIKGQVKLEDQFLLRIDYMVMEVQAVQAEHFLLVQQYVSKITYLLIMGYIRLVVEMAP